MSPGVRPTIWSAARTWWRYLGAHVQLRLDEVADPKVQLDEAITSASEQHRRLTEHAATVIAHQKLAERRLARAFTEYSCTREAVQQARVPADRLVALERQIDDLRMLLLDATQAAEHARLAVRVSAAALQRNVEHRQRLLVALDQVQVHEHLLATLTHLRASVGGLESPFARVEETIDARVARAQAMADLTRWPG
jgi:phage shock protein A